MKLLTSTLSRATFVILMALRPKFKLHFVSLTSASDGAMQICIQNNKKRNKETNTLAGCYLADFLLT